MIILKGRREIEFMRQAGRVVAEALAALERRIAPGVTTLELNRLAEEILERRGAVPAFKGYRGFPASICTSVNEEVVHGIPGLKKLVEGDIISIDIGAVINGYYGDAAATFPVGVIDEEKRRLLEVTREALWQGIRHAVVGNRLSDISYAIQSHVEKEGFSVVRDYVGHGIGSQMHEEPQVPNFGSPGRGPRLRPGMTLAIEPMVNAGGHQVMTREDGWTVVTADGRPSAHFEHTVAITDNGPEVLTLL
ncbi:type I methionyl aminopeptidase [Thermanaeromonas sp. C210]|uniref:type I methionyl aminopeptidase n=1 Tax=Thermanaeromonas sp. C210 TaxID=2731925 RepID=UPI00155B6631|nr:type I methionyl aminopeptidase [Thermanaeromonas sp. C210]GFN23025.1 methionine aminopeptidase [Thermanaeromonas sp. C210]